MSDIEQFIDDNEYDVEGFRSGDAARAELQRLRAFVEGAARECDRWATHAEASVLRDAVRKMGESAREALTPAARGALREGMT